MSIDVSDLRPTIVPKSDQLNADQLISGPMTIKVTDVHVGATIEQPVIVHYENDNGRPFKPCKTMRRVLIVGWGPDGREWAGKYATVYNDPRVMFGKDEVGGVRISHMSDILKDIEVKVSVSKGKRATYVVKKMDAPIQGMKPEQIADWVQSIEAAAADELDAIKASALEAAKAAQDREAFAKFSSAAKKRRAELAQ